MTNVAEMPEIVEFIRQNLSTPIVMTGLMGAGKSTVGEMVAHILDLDFVDSDQKIEKTESMSIADIFAEHGEDHFREIERNTIRDLTLQLKPCVIGTGGGAFMCRETRELILSRAVSMFLKCDLEILTKRVGDGAGRPLFKDKKPKDVLETLIFSRYPTYSKADITVESEDEMAEETAKKVIESLYKHLKAA